jgi:hypothetical protein
MKASELPNGSLIYFDNELVRVDWANEHVIQFFQIEKGYEYPGFSPNIDKHIKPVPITEEWLIKFGFRYNEIFEHWRGKIEIKKVSGEYYLIIDDRHVGFNGFKFIHQLQNLCFVLTGEELVL